MGERIEKVKEHLKEHKEVYICAGIASFTLVIMRRELSGKARLSGHTDSGKARLSGHTAFSFFGKASSSGDQIVNVIEREGRGHPGYLIQHKESGVVYPSQKAAADVFDVNYTNMSNHLNGRQSHINGNHFERVIVAQ